MSNGSLELTVWRLSKKRYREKAFIFILLYICKRTAFLQKYILFKKGHTLHVAGEFSLCSY